MSQTAEIYLCKVGQDLKQGRIEYGEDVTTRAAAKVDAEARSARDNTLAKIAYYVVGDDGDFRCIYTHTNPDAIGGKKEKSNGDVRLGKKKKKKPHKLTFWQKLFGKKSAKKAKKAKKARRSA